ncbi:homoserine dehydrogenase [Alicyclobacillus sp. SO9]|uniref:homoserine dehydrogenase n=1 Tax=Alicyclobacillus sp. SO9 TaxID=2665646 RepID=UPI0018E82FCB|nr:homoserine dehydrogenase [Alicyclobacillus sp. SO9]QQE79034.1 homoserine dehydrogenase [Alicyclobacillus sp. SO9]
MTHKLAFIGFGTVGQGLAEILLEKEAALTDQLGEKIAVVAISDALKGSLYDPEGLELQTALRVVNETDSLSAYPDTPTLTRDMNAFDTIQHSSADTIVEVTYTNVETGQPAIDHCRYAFESGKNVVTTNKGPVALAYKELSQLAKKRGVRWGFEGTVMSGTPSLRMPINSLAGNEIREIKGIFNGTTNYMLTRMESGLTYAEALEEAQANGYAEANPTSDVEGYDAMYKILILSNVIMKVPLSKEQIQRRGITDIHRSDIEQASNEGKRWKLVARVRRNEDHTVSASVAPEQLPMTDPLAGIAGATNAITYDCDLSGPITLVGAGAGKVETGFSLLIDIINIVRNQM